MAALSGFGFNDVPFLSFCLRSPGDTTGNDDNTIIGREGRAKIAKKGARLVSHGTMGRGYKSVLRHLGMYTFEDY
jgi:hypothetical protein